MVWSAPNHDNDYNDDIHEPSFSAAKHRQPRRLSTSSSFTASTTASITSSERTWRSPTVPSQGDPSAASFTQSHDISQSHISATPQDDVYNPDVYNPDDNDDDSLLIPSAQPTTPISTPAISSQQFSISDHEPSPLPSPPDSQPASSPPPPRHDPLPVRTRPPIRAAPPLQPAPPRQPPPRRADDADDEDSLFNSVLEGIGRIHVTMGQDDAGRWRIRRKGAEHF